MEVTLAGFSDWMDVVGEGKRSIKNNFKFLGINGWGIQVWANVSPFFQTNRKKSSPIVNA